MTTTYYAEQGRVFARTPEGTREVTTALSSNARDLARFERALGIARTQERPAIEEELVGITEIATITGLATQTVYNYRQKGKLPTPDYELAVGPVWRRATIERWNVERNRKPGPPAELIEQWKKSKTGAA